MGSKTRFCSLIFMAILLLVIIGEASGCKNDQRCLHTKAESLMEIKGRKMLAVWKNGLSGTEITNNNINGGEKLMVAELRTVPSGPDPLHHHGGSNKKPITP